MMTRNVLMAFSVALVAVGVSCSKENEPANETRTFRMGFQSSAPRFDDFNLAITALQLWVEPGDLADAAMITTEVPWTELSQGQSVVDYVNTQYKGLVDYYRQHGFELWVYIDPENGLNRTVDSQPLAAMGKSIADQESQNMYKRFVIVMDSILKPEHIGLALETNLIRISAPASIYNGVVKASNDAALELRQRNSKAKISVSVQADVAWGSLQGTFQYTGIKQDLTDFSFVEELGISSYPYFAYPDPANIPDDYYSRLQSESKLNVFVSEGSWTSETITGPNNNQIVSSQQKQADYILKQYGLLEKANGTALFSLTFTDIDLSTLPSTVDPSVKYFAYLGVVDKDLKPKQSLSAWRNVFAHKLITSP